MGLVDRPVSCSRRMCKSKSPVLDSSDKILIRSLVQLQIRPELLFVPLPSSDLDVVSSSSHMPASLSCYLINTGKINHYTPWAL